MHETALSLDMLRAASGGRLGAHDLPCLLCSAERSTAAKRKLPVLRIWNVSPTFSTFNCMHCGARGETHDRTGARVDPVALRRARDEAAARDRQSIAEGLRVALWFWRSSTGIRGTLGERYFREHRGYRGSLPATLRFKPARGEHPATVVAAYGIPAEPEPGVLSINDSVVRGVHLIKLAPDGSKHPGEGAKKTRGRCPGVPIVLSAMGDNLGLAVTEGVEDALCIYESTGLGVWATGGGGRFPALADTVPDYTDCVTVFEDDDDTGRNGARALVAGLHARGISASAIRLGAEATP